MEDNTKLERDNEYEIYNVASLSEFYAVIEGMGEEDGISRFWFRGHGYNYYTLIPTLYRNKFYHSNKSITYTQMNLKEDYRYQHIKSRAFHCVTSNPSYQSEWQEIYQHHFGHTRLMDWSESARTALDFALEPFIDTRDNKELEYKRKNMTPCVWVLDPYELNKRVYKYMGEEKAFVNNKAFKRVYGRKLSLKKLCNEMKNNQDKYFDNGDGDLDIKGIISLCAIEDYRKNLGSGFIDAVNSFEFNPYYFLALKMYSDALPFEVNGIDDKILPPIALLHPYHSERIRAQRGVFTMFPNYVLSEEVEKMCKNRKVDIRNMEEQWYIRNCLKVIYIVDPHRVARELLLSGERRSVLYPDINVYADIIETNKYFY